MISGKATLSIRKRDLENQKSGAKLFTRIVFAHKATAGDTGFTLTSLTTPTEMSSTGFTQPTVGQLLAASIKLNRSNLRLKSSAQGDLTDFLDYTVDSNTRVTFNGFTAAADEIFVGIIDLAPATGAMVVDAMPLVATGVLAANQTDINVGTSFQTNKYPTSQVGAVTVFIEGQQIFRNTGNSSVVLDANYHELEGTNGNSSVIRMNASDPSPRSYLVISNGILAERPAGSFLGYLESTQGQVNKVIEVLSDVSGQPESYFQSAPTNVDLKAFGDRVLGLEEPGSPGTPKLASISEAGAVESEQGLGQTLTTSSLTNVSAVTVNNSSYTVVNDLVILVMRLNFTITVTGNFSFNIDLPVAAVGDNAGGGGGYARNSGNRARYGVQVISSTQVEVYGDGDAAAYADSYITMMYRRA